MAPTKRSLRAAAQGVARSIEHRDQLIIEAHQAGWSLRQIAEAIDSNAMAVKRIIERNR